MSSFTSQMGFSRARRFKRKHSLGHTEMSALEQALKSHSLSGTGPVTEQYEESLCIWFNARYALAVSSGSAAVMVALAAVGVKPGDEVIVSPASPLCTAYPIMSMGATPVFCDTQPDCLSLDLDMLESLITERTAAIVDVPMWGYPTPAASLSRKAKARGLPLILDLAHCHGTTYQEKHLWEYSDIACFSTHESKIMSTGEGGFVLTNSPELADRAGRFRQMDFLEGKNIGINLKLSSLQAALGLARLDKLSEEISIRKRNADFLKSAIGCDDIAELPVVEGACPNYYTLLLRSKSGKASDFIDHLYAHGIPSDMREYPCRPLYEFPILKYLTNPCPNATRFLLSVSTFPTHPEMDEFDLEYLAAALSNYRPRTTKSEREST